jgi:hypothetical protein
MDWKKKKGERQLSTTQRQNNVKTNLAVCQEVPELVTLGEAGNFENAFHPFF